VLVALLSVRWPFASTAVALIASQRAASTTDYASDANRDAWQRRAKPKQDNRIRLRNRFN
jgi:hypothetical protein